MDLKLCFPVSSNPSLFMSSMVLRCPSPHFLPTCQLSKRTHVPLSSNCSANSFLGQGLAPWNKPFQLKNTHRCISHIVSVVKRRKEISFDNVIQRDKKLKLVLRIRSILVSQPDRVMALRHLGKFRKELGLTKKRRFIALLRRFPAVFEIVEEGVYSLKFRLTPEAERLYMEELKVRNEMEGESVVKLRKLLMMSIDKRILIEKISHLRTDLGLPVDFRTTVCRRYPQYFQVVSTGGGPALELTHWDPELAVSVAEVTAEENKAREIEEMNLIIDRPPKFNRVKLPKGLKLSKGEMRRLVKFNEIPYISPYADFSELKPGTPEKEKHACGVIHEILSMCLEKRTLVDHLTHFREEFRFSQQLRGMLIRHPDMFYVSLKGDRDSVFLREAYHGSQLKEKDRLLIIKEKLRVLVAVPRFPRRPVGKPDTDVGSEKSDPLGVDESEGDDDWSEIENLMGDELGEDLDGLDDGDDDPNSEEEDDGWDNEEDDFPPDFDDNSSTGFEQVKPSNRVKVSPKPEEKVVIPVLPDGRPRERCPRNIFDLKVHCLWRHDAFVFLTAAVSEEEEEEEEEEEMILVAIVAELLEEYTLLLTRMLEQLVHGAPLPRRVRLLIVRSLPFAPPPPRLTWAS
ncbi:ROOT PRIMORDIUM DEFECTIVE 1 protein [Nymphaea thermarum]|nr:ROOT PRIMORDIUM DEFECTIVE 1 protein [Nymphaea thermarum]